MPVPSASVAATAVVPATETPVSLEPTTSTPKPASPEQLDVRRVLAHTRAIELKGRRPEGGAAEHAAANYIVGQLRDLGYQVEVEPFRLPSGLISRNVVARAAGADARVVVLSAHIDSKRSTPGANDNAAGCGILLEIARILAKQPAHATVEFDFFGSEEFTEKPHDHHYGSRYHVAHLTRREREHIAGMVSSDVVGYGSRFVVRTMGIGPSAMSRLLLSEAKRLHVPLSYSRDPGATGWSDHEAYEKAGIPAAWLERLQDPEYHQPGDTTAHLQPAKLRESGQFVLDVVRGLDARELDALYRR